MHRRPLSGIAALASLALIAGLLGWGAPAARATSAIVFSPSPVDFGTVSLGASSMLSTTVTNTSGGTLTVNAVSSTGSAYFARTGGTCAADDLLDQATCTIEVTFTPLVAGIATGTVAVETSAGTFSADVTGDGLDPIQLTGDIDFGLVSLNTGSSPRPAGYTNFGTATVKATSLVISGADAADFAITSNDCLNLDVTTATGCRSEVTFTPSALGSRSATLTITGAFPLGTRTIALTGTGDKPLAGITWGAISKAGPAHTWNLGDALGRTVQSGTQRLHLAYATDVVGGKTAKDSGPHQGVYYTRSTSGATWSKGKRLNPTTQHADRSGLATAGSRVYAIWVSQKSVDNFNAKAARALYVRVNTSHGSATRWKTAIRLTSSTGRVDYPTIAATGNDVHIAWTNSVTGGIKVATSRDRGTTWKTRSIGTTTYSGPQGFEGIPYVAASGASVVVAWAANNADAILARVSTDHGAHWGATATLATSSDGSFSVAARGSRYAASWTDAAGVVLSVGSGSTWSPARVVAQPTGTSQYAPIVALQDASHVGVAWAEDETGTGFTALKWAESPDDGVAFFQTQTVADTGPIARQYNDWASVQWPAANKRIVTWNGYSNDGTAYRQYVRIGTGTTSGLLVTASLRREAGTSSAVGRSGSGVVRKGGPLDRQ